MREIKYKAWDRIDKKMRIVTRMTFGLPATGHTPLIIHLDDGTDNPVTRSIDDIDLLQYTGRKEKNGIEIYEGDIIGCYESQLEPQKMTAYQIKWDEGSASFVLINKENRWGLGYGELFSLEIIGNIYENPELLSQSKS